MTNTELALFVLGFLLSEAIVITFILAACRLAGEADDAADKAARQLANGDCFPCVLTPPEDASPGDVPHAIAGGSLNHSFHSSEIARG